MFDNLRISQAAWSIVACMFCIAMTAFTRDQKVINAFYAGSIGFGLLAVVIVILIWIQTGTDRVESMERFIRAYQALDEEGRMAVSYQFPTIRYRMKRGKVLEYWEDTQVPIETFRLFLQDCTKKQIAPERNWNSTERPRWAWEEIKETLESSDLILPDSAAGSHSWLWVNESAYQRLMVYWMAGKRPVNLSEAEIA